jgi:hypothetical protein
MGRRSRDACVRIGEEAAPPDELDRRRRALIDCQPLDRRRTVRRERVEPPFEFDADGERSVWARLVRAADDRHVLAERESLEQACQPVLPCRLGILCEERDVGSGGLVHQQVARPAVAELRRRDLDDTRPMLARNRHRVVARPRVAHEQLVLDRLAFQRA